MAEYTLPYQRLTDSEKKTKYGSVEKWAESVVYALDNEYIGRDNWSTLSADKYDLQINLDLAAGKLNLQDFEHIVSEYRLDKVQNPNNLKNYPLIPQIVNLLLGEKIKRPFNFRAVQTNAEAVTMAEEKKKEMLINSMFNTLRGAISGEQEQGQDQNQEQETPEQIEKYLNYSWSDINEKTAQQILDYLKEKLSLRRKFSSGFKTFTSTGSAVFYVGQYNNEPYMREVNLLNFDYDKSPDNMFIEDASWAREVEYITASEVYDRYYDELSHEDINTIEEWKGVHTPNAATNSSVPIYYHSDKDIGLYGQETDYHNNTLIRVAHCVWKGLKKVAFVDYVDEVGIPQQSMFNHGEFNKNEFPYEITEIRWRWINEVWETTRIGEDIFVNARPRPVQYNSLDNPSHCKLPYVGLAYDYCLVDMLKSYQYLYNVMMYRFEQAVAMSKGKAILFDISQLPKSQGIDIEKFIYYLTTAGIAFVNSAEEGMDGIRSQFNQFQVFDLTLANSIQYYISTLDKIEQAAGDLVGVSKQRQGQTHQRELVGNVERSITQSSHITEHLFDVYSELEKRTLQSLVEESRHSFKNGKKAVYVLDDLTKVHLDVSDSFSLGEYDVFFSNNSRDQEIINITKQLAQAAMQNNQATLSDIMSIINTDSIADSQRKLEASEEKQFARQQEERNSQLQSNEKLKEIELADKEAEREFQRYKVELDNDTKIKVAEIQSFSFQKDQDSNDNGVPDQLEIEKLKIDKKKLQLEQAKTEKELDLKEKDLEIKADKVKSDKNKKPTK